MFAPRNLTLEFMALPGPNAAPAVVAPAVPIAAAAVAPVAAVAGAPATPHRGIPPHNGWAPVRHSQ